jgi:hypothetical protein
MVMMVVYPEQCSRWKRRVGLVALGLMVAACSGNDGPFDMGWGLTCSSDRFSAVALDHDGTQGFDTPEIAVDRFLHPDVPEGVPPDHLPGSRLPKDGWERADFVPTRDGTEPIDETAQNPYGSADGLRMAFVHREGDRIVGVLMLLENPGGWVVDDVHTCAS